MPTFEYATVYRHRKNGALFLQAMRRHSTGASIEIGPLIEVKELTDLGAGTLRLLGEYRLPYLDSDAPSMSNEEYRQFRRIYQAISVKRDEESQIHVAPLKPVSGGYESVKSDERKLVDPSAAELSDAILGAFDISERVS